MKIDLPRAICGDIGIAQLLPQHADIVSLVTHLDHGIVMRLVSLGIHGELQRLQAVALREVCHKGT
jgi:hypothetical protein